MLEITCNDRLGKKVSNFNTTLATVVSGLTPIFDNRF